MLSPVLTTVTIKVNASTESATAMMDTTASIVAPKDVRVTATITEFAKMVLAGALMVSKANYVMLSPARRGVTCKGLAPMDCAYVLRATQASIVVLSGAQRTALIMESAWMVNVTASRASPISNAARRNARTTVAAMGVATTVFAVARASTQARTVRDLAAVTIATTTANARMEYVIAFQLSSETHASIDAASVIAVKMDSAINRTGNVSVTKGSSVKIAATRPAPKAAVLMAYATRVNATASRVTQVTLVTNERVLTIATETAFVMSIPPHANAMKVGRCQIVQERVAPVTVSDEGHVLMELVVVISVGWRTIAPKKLACRDVRLELVVTGHVTVRKVTLVHPAQTCVARMIAAITELATIFLEYVSVVPDGREKTVANLTVLSDVSKVHVKMACANVFLDGLVFHVISASVQRCVPIMVSVITTQPVAAILDIQAKTVL